MSSILNYLNHHQAEMLAFTQRLINQDTPSADPEAILTADNLIIEKMHALKMTTQIIHPHELGTILVGELPGTISGQPVILTGHVDTVFPTGESKRRPFIIDNDHFFGPGVFDMKPGITIGLFAIQALQALKLPHPPIKLIIISDEEKLHRGSQADATLPTLFKGASYGLNLEGSEAYDHLTIKRRGGMIIEVTVTGQAAHSGSHPQDGESAVLELAHQIIRLSALTDYTNGIHVNCGTIQGGESENIIPAFAQTHLGVRFKTESQRQALLAKIEAIADNPTNPHTQVKVTVATRIHPMDPTDTTYQLFNQVNTASQQLGLGELTAVNSGGASDAGILATLGIPVLDSLGIVGGKAHTADEFATVDSLIKRTALITQTLTTVRLA